MTPYDAGRYAALAKYAQGGTLKNKPLQAQPSIPVRAIRDFPSLSQITEKITQQEVAPKPQTQGLKPWRGR